MSPTVVNTVKPSRTTLRAVALLSVPLLLSACGAGRDPLTYGDRDQGDSTEVVADTIYVSNLRIQPPKEGFSYPAGADARAALTLVNDAAEPDALVAVETDAATSVAFVQGTTTVAQIPIPALGTADPSYSLVLLGLTREVRAAGYVTVRLVFAKAPAIEALVPVSTPTEVRPRATANPRLNEPAHGGGGEHHDEVENVVEKAGESAGESSGESTGSAGSGH